MGRHSRPVFVVCSFLFCIHFVVMSREPISCWSRSEGSEQEKHVTFEGRSRDIIQRAFMSSYGRMYPCNRDELVKGCFNKTLGFHRNSTDLPWWFRTLLRDSGPQTNAWYQFIRSKNPPLRHCSLGKIGSKQWHLFFRILNGEKTPGLKRSLSWSEHGLNDQGPKFVILRDPLERFLSAFLDKCVNEHRRREEHHCEPREVFERDDSPTVGGLMDNPHAYFEAYVNAMPLKWNMHFVPMSLACDGLYRTIGEYDFVGYMGPEFLKDLKVMSERYGSKVERALNQVFSFADKINTTNDGIETRAPTKVLQYYNPSSVRKVLEYLSIDYVMLNLTVPAWAEEMLHNDEHRLTPYKK